MQFVDEIYPAVGEQQQHENNAYISSDSANFGRSQRPTFVRVHQPSPQQSPTGSSKMRSQHSASMQNADRIVTGASNKCKWRLIVVVFCSIMFLLLFLRYFLTYYFDFSEGEGVKFLNIYNCTQIA